MKTKTLNEFLSFVDANRKSYGDMLMCKSKNVDNQLEITFSETSTKYLFYWDKAESNWFFLRQEIEMEEESYYYQINYAS